MIQARANDKRDRQFLLVAACFLVSGFAALLYETVWLRQFAVLLGTSEQALAVVLSSYMGGLAIGSMIASRLVNVIRRPLLIYGLLEFGVALAAWFVPYGIALASALQTAMIGGNADPPDAGGWGQVVFCFATAFGLVFIPTALMGATLPLLARHVVSRDEEVGPRIGALYAINTAGAVSGTVLAAFYCLPALGLGRTTWVGIGSNVFVFLIVLWMVKNHGQTETIETEAIKTTSEGRDQRHRPVKRQSDDSVEGCRLDARYRRVLWLALFSGAVSFGYEIVFTRMLGQMLGGSVYAFSTMLSGFLLGIAIGGAIASRLATTRHLAAQWFVYAQSGAAVSALVSFAMVNEMVTWSWDTEGTGINTMEAFVSSVITLLPTSTCIGATFPLAIRIYTRDQAEAAQGSAQVYFWNVLGGIAGALITGVTVMPLLQYHGTIAVAVGFNIALAIVAALMFQVRPVHLLVPAAAFVLLCARMPSEPENILRVSALTGRLTPGEIIFNDVGRSATVTVFQNRGEILFQTNGLPESQLQLLGSAEIYRYSGYWLSALPPLVRPECRSMLIIGLGGGMAAELVPPSIEAIDVLEIEDAVLRANQAVADQRNFDPLADPRINIVLNDGRNALALTDKKYDAIVSQPSHPWTAGASHLYSREFNETVRQHLRPGGVFLQWMDSEFVDIELTQSMGATLLDVFSHVRLYQPSPGVFMFLASDQPIEPELRSQMINGNPVVDVNEQDREFFQRLGVVNPTHLFSMLTLDEPALREFSSGAELITDERNLLAMRAPYVTDAENLEVVESFLESRSPINQGLDVALELCPTFDLKTYLLQRTNRKEREWVQQHGLPMLANESDRASVVSKLLRVSNSPSVWLDSVKALSLKYPDNSDLAFELLSNRVLGMEVDSTEEEEQQLRMALSQKHAMVLELLEKLMDGDLMSSKYRDAELASWSVDDVAFEIAVRLRLPWRLESPVGERVFRCREAIEIIDRSAPFANWTGLAFFRVSAALKAGQPQQAIGTSLTLARMMQRSMDEEDQSSVAAGVANLGRCYALLSDRRLFAGVTPQRYQDALAEVRGVLAAASRQ